jgi:hypothetical protein
MLPNRDVEVDFRMEELVEIGAPKDEVRNEQERPR